MLIEANSLSALPILPPLAPIHTAGEEGEYFEGDIRLKPGEDPYGIFQTYRHRISKRTVKDVNEDILSDGSGLGPLPAEYYSQRVWPNRRIPYAFRPHLRKPRILL